MLKKLPLLLTGIATAGAITAVGFVAEKMSLTVPDSAEKTETAAPLMKTLGAKRSIPLRAPEGGYTAPVTFAPTQEQFNECTIVDVNDDGTKWKFEDGYFKYPYNSTNDANDWCILPAMNLEAGTYKITYTYRTRSDNEDFRMCLGQSTDPASMTITVMEKNDYSNQVDVTESRTVELAAGEWHIGLYAYSPKYRFAIMFKNISIEKLDMSAPKSPLISLVADGHDCTVDVTLPTQNLGGEALTAASVSATVYLDEQPVKGGTFSGAPGESKTITFNVETSGTHSISAVATVDGTASEPAVIDHKFSKKQPVPTPMGYTFAPDNDEFEWCTVINANDDNSTWQWCDSGYPEGNNTGEGAFRYNYSYYKDADDWLILPAFAGGAAGARKLTMNVATKYNDEGFEVCMAYEPTAEALSQNVILKKPRFQSAEEFIPAEATFSVEENREFYVAIHAISPANASYMYLQNICVDLTDGSAPQAPTLSDPDFDGGDGTVTLTLPLKNLDGVEMDASVKVFADITLDGESYGQTVEGAPGEVKEIEFSGLALGTHTVTARTFILSEDNERVGDKEASISFKCRISSSFAYNVPLELDLNKEIVDNFLIIDANEDDKTWFGESEWFKYGYHSDNQADDWFISPAIEVTDISSLYEIGVSAKCNSGNMPETIEVFIGREQSIAGMTTLVTGPDEVKNEGINWQIYGNTLAINEPGRYYVGVHCVSAPNMYNLMVNKLIFKASEATNNSPAAVSDLTGDGIETGELMADVTFRFPTTTLGGEAIDADMTLTATVTSESETKTAEGKPGEEKTVRIACPEGKSIVTVKVSSDNGEGPMNSVEVNCGLDRPTAPVITALTVAEDNMSVTIDYAAITTGVSGGHVNPDGMNYYLWEWDGDDEDWYQIDVTDQLTMTYDLGSATHPLTALTLGLQAYNGLNSGSAMTAFTVVLGTPYTLPMEETFEQGSLHYYPITLSSSLESDYAPVWGLVDPSEIISGVTSEEGGFALYGHTSFNRGDSFIGLPKFSTENIDDAEIEISTYHHPASCELTLMAAAHGMDQYSILGSVEIPQTTDGWKKFTFPLGEELSNRKWVDARLYVNFTGGSSSIPMIDSYVVRSASQSGTGIVDAVAEGSVKGLSGAILFTGFAGETARIFLPAGTMVAAVSLSDDSLKVDVAPGIYVVAVGDKTFKVSVR